MPTQAELDQWQVVITATDDMLAIQDPNGLEQQIRNELDAAQAALDEAKTAFENGQDAQARNKLKQSMDHTKKAIDLMKQLVG